MPPLSSFVGSLSLLSVPLGYAAKPYKTLLLLCSGEIYGFSHSPQLGMSQTLSPMSWKMVLNTFVVNRLVESLVSLFREDYKIEQEIQLLNP